MSFEDCEGHNYEAIGQLLAGECLEAIESLNKALTVLRPLIAELQMDAPEMYDSRQDMRCSVPIMEDHMVQASPLLSSDNNVFAFYPCMFEIQDSCLRKAEVLLTYNLAVAHHVHGSYHHLANEEAITTRRARLLALLQMYQSVAEAAQRAPEVIDGQVLCAMVAAVNNQGHLHGFLQGFQEVRSNVELQISLLELSQGPCSIPEGDFALLLSSVYALMEGPGLSIPPAA